MYSDNFNNLDRYQYNYGGKKDERRIGRTEGYQETLSRFFTRIGRRRADNK